MKGKDSQKLKKQQNKQAEDKNNQIYNNKTLNQKTLKNKTAQKISNKTYNVKRIYFKTKKFTLKDKKYVKKQKKILKQQKRDFVRYGLRPTDIKTRHAKSGKEARQGFPALKKCLKYFKDYKWGVMLMLFFGLLYAVLCLLEPIFTEKMINGLSIGADNLDVAYVLTMAGFVAVVSIVARIVSFAWISIDNIVFQKVVRKLRLDVLDSVSRTKTSKFDQVNSGEIVSRMTSDTGNVVDIVNVVINNFTSILIAIGYTIYICFINLYLGLMLIAFVILIFIFENGLQKYNRKMYRRKNAVYDKILGLIGEVVRGIRDIKNLNVRNNAKKKVHQNINYMSNVAIDLEVGRSAWKNARQILEQFSAFIFIVFGVFLFVNGNILLGSLIVAVFYRWQAFYLITYLSDIRTALRNASVSAERICQILDDKDYPKEEFGTKEISNPVGKIEFKNVCFKYNDNAEVFKNLNLKIDANKSVAFVGKSGQGKSTLLNLIPRLYDISSGKILIDGVDTKTLSEDGLRNLVTVVPQTPYIFNDTIKENLKLVKEDLTDQEMIDVCKKAQIHDFIMSKPDSYDSLVGENGVILSGGQKQRLAIARALIKQSKIILLDEATSALDNENQSKIQKVIEDLTKTHTVLIVAHRLSTVVNCDEIVMIENGKIINKGTHAYMMKNCEPYKKLYKTEQKASAVE